MGRQWFVRPVTARLDLGDGQWVEIKERLDYGETQQLTATTLAQDGSLTAGQAPTIRLDLAGYKVERLCMFLVDWSARDADDKPVPVTRETIKALDPAMAAVIDAAIDRHLEALGVNPTVPTPTSPSR